MPVAGTRHSAECCPSPESCGPCAQHEILLDGDDGPKWSKTWFWGLPSTTTPSRKKIARLPWPGLLFDICMVQDSKNLFHLLILLFFGVFSDYSDRWWLVDTIILDAHSGRARRLLCYRKLWKLMWIVVTLKNSLHCNFILTTCSQIVTFQISGKVHTCVESPETYPSMVLRVLVLLEAIEHCPKPA